MNQMPFDIEIENPWKKRDAIPYPKMIRLVPIALIYILAALVPVFFMSETFSLIAYVGMCVGTIYALRMPRIVISVLLASFIPVALTQSFAIGALVLSVVVATGGGALLATSVRTPSRTVILPMIAWVVSFVITRDAYLSSLTLVTLPATVLLALATVTGQRRTSAICYTIGGFLISVVALLAIYFTATYGSIDRNVLVTHFETQRAWLVDVLLSVRDQMIEMMQAEGLGGSETVEVLQSYMTRELLTNLVALVYNVLPAIVIILCSIMAFEAQSFLCAAYCTMGMKKMLTPVAVTFTMSLVSAILYLAAFVINLFVPAGGLFMAVVQNFYLILTPGFFLVGYAAVMFRLRTAKGGSKFFLIFLLIAILCFSPASIFSVLAFFGADTVVLSAISLRMMKQMQNGQMGNFTHFDPRKDEKDEKNQDEDDERDEDHDKKD